MDDGVRIPIHSIGKITYSGLSFYREDRRRRKDVLLRGALCAGRNATSKGFFISVGPLCRDVSYVSGGSL